MACTIRVHLGSIVTIPLEHLRLYFFRGSSPLMDLSGSMHCLMASPTEPAQIKPSGRMVTEQDILVAIIFDCKATLGVLTSALQTFLAWRCA